jgi:hypothetical protein
MIAAFSGKNWAARTMKSRGRERRGFGVVTAAVLCSLWSAPSSATPERPRLNRLPVASLTPLAALSPPEEVGASASNLPFSIEIPEDRKLREAALR